MKPDDDDEEEAAEPDEDSDGFFVPHGYLSEGEGCEDDDDDEKNPVIPHFVYIPCKIFEQEEGGNFEIDAILSESAATSNNESVFA